jgi:antitoxin (DNA-binding transcriptional repressor) of toxin-antitoxin stability system
MRFTITQRGQPVADLIPTGAEARGLGAAAAGRMRKFMARGSGTPQTSVSAADIKALAADGRD